MSSAQLANAQSVRFTPSSTFSPPHTLINDPQHWRQRGEKLRTLADDVIGEVARAMILRVAADYDRLAKRAEERRRRRDPDETENSGWNGMR